MPRSSPYNQLGIGDCGHVVHTWPQVHALGGGTKVICDDCTREEYGIPSSEGIWVYLREEEIAPKPKQPKKPSKPKEKPLTALQTILRQEGLW